MDKTEPIVWSQSNWSQLFLQGRGTISPWALFMATYSELLASLQTSSNTSATFKQPPWFVEFCNDRELFRGIVSRDPIPEPLLRRWILTTSQHLHLCLSVMHNLYQAQLWVWTHEMDSELVLLANDLLTETNLDSFNPNTLFPGVLADKMLPLHTKTQLKARFVFLYHLDMRADCLLQCLDLTCPCTKMMITCPCQNDDHMSLHQNDDHIFLQSKHLVLTLFERKPLETVLGTTRKENISMPTATLNRVSATKQTSKNQIAKAWSKTSSSDFLHNCDNICLLSKQVKKHVES